MRINSAQFERAAFKPGDEPQGPWPMVVFLGRSNVGKSSLINRLLGTKGLARTSSQPGRTQSVNFYRVNGHVRFVDLPGYGYAKVPKTVRDSWRPMVEGFLERRREAIRLALLVVDSRHATRELDLIMRDWVDASGISYLVAATKADKLSGNKRARAARELKKSLGGGEHGNPIMTSATTGLGIREIWRCIDKLLAGTTAGDREEP